MRLISIDPCDVMLGISEPESALVGNVLNEFINGIHIAEAELERRLGLGRPALRQCHEQLIAQIQGAEQAESDDHSRGLYEIPVQLTNTQVVTISRALSDLASGTDIEAWEFPIRLGQAPEEAIRLANELDNVIESWSP
jgi:hypothetical protein